MSKTSCWLDLGVYPDSLFGIASPRWLKESVLNAVNEKSPQCKFYCLGRNVDAETVLAKYRVDGVIDDYAPCDSVFHGVKVVGLNSVNSCDFVVNCVSSISPVTAYLRARNRTPFVFSYAQLDLWEGKLGRQRFVAEQLDDLHSHTDSYLRFYANLFDYESKNVFKDVFGFRCSGDIRKMSAYRTDPLSQYFEDFLLIGGEVFLDVGGFDGDTALQFSVVDSQYKSIFVLEPSEKNRIKAERSLRSLRNTKIMPVGASSFNGVLGFDGDHGSASRIVVNSDTQIEVRRIDDLGLENVSFIKMDIEGGELSALTGAAGLIRKNRPKLAIAAYHKPSDLRDISEFILGIHADYRVSLRHYTEGWSETVLYFY